MHGHVWSRGIIGNRTDIEHATAPPSDHARKKAKRQVGQGTYRSGSKHPKFGAVHQHVAIDADFGELVFDKLPGVDAGNIDGEGVSLYSRAAELCDKIVEGFLRTTEKQHDEALAGSHAGTLAPIPDEAPVTTIAGFIGVCARWAWTWLSRERARSLPHFGARATRAMVVAQAGCSARSSMSPCQ